MSLVPRLIFYITFLSMMYPLISRPHLVGTTIQSQYSMAATRISRIVAVAKKLATSTYAPSSRLAIRSVLVLVSFDPFPPLWDPPLFHVLNNGEWTRLTLWDPPFCHVISKQRLEDLFNPLGPTKRLKKSPWKKPYLVHSIPSSTPTSSPLRCMSAASQPPLSSPPPPPPHTPHLPRLSRLHL